MKKIGFIDLLKDIPDIKVYATKFTKYVLIEEGINPNNIIDVKPHKKINFGDNYFIFNYFKYFK